MQLPVNIPYVKKAAYMDVTTDVRSRPDVAETVAINEDHLQPRISTRGIDKTPVINTVNANEK